MGIEKNRRQEKTNSKANIQSLDEYISSMTSESHKSCRSQAKIKILILLKNIKKKEKQKAIDHLLSVLSETDDPCLQNYLVDILLFQCDPEVDKQLLEVVYNSNGKIADFVKTYVSCMISNDRKRGLYAR